MYGLPVMTFHYWIPSARYEIFIPASFSLTEYGKQFSWFISGRVLLRFLQAAVDNNSQEQIATLTAELNFVQ
jgi:hypothetical protein